MFQNPTKPIGPFLNPDQSQCYERERCWTVVQDAGRGWHRVVPSPLPLEIVESDAIGRLVDEGYVVIGANGGGIPVVRNSDTALKGVEAVIDTDLASALLLTSIRANLFLISTAVEKVALNLWQTQPARARPHDSLGGQTIYARGALFSEQYEPQNPGLRQFPGEWREAGID